MAAFRYHVFISHAAEDKAEIADPLNALLRQAGFRVWYSGNDLKPGHHMDPEITKAIAGSKYAVVIISPAFLESRWGAKELDALIAREHLQSREIILPVWHNVSTKQIRKIFPSQPGRFALYSGDGMDKLVAKLAAMISRRRPPVRKTAPRAKHKPDAPVITMNDSGMSLSGGGTTLNVTNLAGRDLHIKK